MIPKNRISVPNFFNSKIVSALSIFEKQLPPRFSLSLSLFSCVMPQISTVGKIWILSDGVEDVLVVCTFLIWDRGYDESLWVHTSVIINISPGFGNISTNIQTPEGGSIPNHCVLVWSISLSGKCLIEKWGLSNFLCDSWMGSRYLPIILQTLSFPSATIPDPPYP